MKTIIYFIGRRRTRNLLERRLGRIGYSLASFQGDYRSLGNSLIIYELESLAALDVNLPNNLIILTANPGLSQDESGHVFHYLEEDSERLGYLFTIFLLDFIRRREQVNPVQENDPAEFYSNREQVLLYTLKHESLSGGLEAALQGNRKFCFRKCILEPGAAELPARKLLFLPYSRENLAWIYKNMEILAELPLLLYRFPPKVKRELKNFSSLIPLVFISGFDSLQVRKALKVLS